MYRLNPLMRNVLITTDEVIFHAPTKHTLDPRTIQQSIIIAEERFIRPALCYDLYESIVTAKNKLVTAENKDALQNEINGSLAPGSQSVVLKEGDIVNAIEYLSGDYITLWKTHLWKLTAECVMLLAVPEAFVQFASEGVVHTSPMASAINASGISTPELKSVRWAMDKKLMDRIDPLIEAMHVWICKQRSSDSSKYAGYCKACDCSADGVAYKRKSDWVMGVYDDDQNCDC